MTWTAIISLMLTAYWITVVVRAWLGGRAIPSMPELRPTAANEPPAKRARVSVIIPARDEAARIRQTVERLLLQRAVDLELLVVDDNSSDGTGAIVEELSRNYPGQVVCETIGELPSGWLGKCYACWRGAQRARGDWLLFCDGDIHMRDDVIARAVQKAEFECADHLTLFPNLVVCHWSARLAILGQSIIFLLYTAPERINRDRGRQSVGIGAFNLIRRSTYDAIDGHHALRLEVVDDMKMGQMVRQHGFRQRVYSGVHDIEADWAQTAAGVVRALEKNWFAAVEYRWWLAIAVLTAGPLLILSAATGPLWAGRWGWLPLIAWQLLAIPGIRISRDFQWPWYLGALAGWGWFVFIAAGIRSVWVTTRQGGIRWRDRFYSLAELREARSFASPPSREGRKEAARHETRNV